MPEFTETVNGRERAWERVSYRDEDRVRVRVRVRRGTGLMRDPAREAVCSVRSRAFEQSHTLRRSLQLAFSHSLSLFVYSRSASAKKNAASRAAFSSESEA